MSEETQLAVLPPAALARAIDPAAWNALKEIYDGASDEKVALVLDYCKARKLDPLKKPVHIVPVYSQKRKCMVETIWPSISETRITAMRTGLFAGQDETKFGPTIKQQIGSLEIEYPEWAQVTVYRLMKAGDFGSRVAFHGPKTYFLECYATRKGEDDLTPNKMWARRIWGQLEKCFDPETEILTDRGFEKFHSAAGRILEVTEQGMRTTEAKPFRREWRGPMIVSDGEALNFAVTPNHDMVLEDGSKMEAGEIFTAATSAPKFRIPHVMAYSRPDAEVADDAIILAAVCVADGTMCGSRNSFRVAVSRDYKVELLSNLGMHSERIVRHCAGDEALTKSGRVITTRRDKEIFVYDKRLVEWLLTEDKAIKADVLLSLSARQAKLFVDTLVAMDGSVSPSGTLRFYTSRKDHIEAFELGAVIAGYAVSSRRERLSDASAKPNYYATITNRESAPVLRYSKSQSSIPRVRQKIAGLVARPNTAGEVWCVTVPSGKVVVRRHGFSMVCGNCAEASALRRAFPEEAGGQATAEEMHGKVLHDDGVVNITTAAGGLTSEPAGVVPAAAGEQVKRAAVPRKSKGAAAVPTTTTTTTTVTPAPEGPTIEAEVRQVDAVPAATPAEPVKEEAPAPAPKAEEPAPKAEEPAPTPAPAPAPEKPKANVEPTPAAAANQEWPKVVVGFLEEVKEAPVRGNPKYQSVKVARLGGGRTTLKGVEIPLSQLGRVIFDPERPELTKFAMISDELVEFTIEQQPAASDPTRMNLVVVRAVVADVAM